MDLSKLYFIHKFPANLWEKEWREDRWSRSFDENMKHAAESSGRIEPIIVSAQAYQAYKKAFSGLNKTKIR